MNRVPTRIRIYWKLGLIALLIVQCLPASHAADIIQKESLALFPFAIASDIDASKAAYVQQHASDLLLLVNEGLAGTQRYAVIAFDPRAMSVARAVQEQQFTEKEIAQPIPAFGGVAKAQKLAALMGANFAMIGSIDKYDFDTSKSEAGLTVTAQLIDVRSGKIGTVVATGMGKGTEGSSRPEEIAGIAAAYDAAEKLLAGIAATSPVEPADNPSVQPSHSKKSKGLIPAMIGAIIIGFLIGSG